MEKKALVNGILLVLNVVILIVNIIFFTKHNDDNIGTENPTEEKTSRKEHIFINIPDIYPPEKTTSKIIDDDTIDIDKFQKDFKWTADSNETKKIIELDFISQADYPTGCESVTACMALRYMGYDISVDTFIDEYLEKHEISVRNGITYGEDPYKYFIGNPRSRGGYGCFSPVIENTLIKIAGSDAVHNLGGRSIDSIIENYVSNGIPVIMWATIDMGEMSPGNSWYISRINQIYTWLGGEHCLLLAGFDEDNYYFYDPQEGLVAYGKDVVKKRYMEMGGQALALVKVNKK